MESSPYSFTPEQYWTEEKERALIAFFSKHSCLWNHKSDGYKNRHLRWKTLEHLRILLSAHPPPVRFTVEDIKNKFKNLRTTFQRQYKMVKASKSSWDHEDCFDRLPPSPIVPQEESQPVLNPPGHAMTFLLNQSTSSSPSPSSSCVPSSMVVKSFWTEERERMLIAFYSDHSCLWNKKSENHNNRHLRLKLLETLRSQLSDHIVTFSVEDIKCKFKNLRTVFNREYKVVQGSRSSDKLYVSKWKHYQQMLFLCESCDEDDNQDDVLILTPPEDKELEHGNQTPSSTLSSLSSSSTLANSVRFNSPSAPYSNTKASPSPGYQIVLQESPDNLHLVNQKSAPAFSVSPTTSPPVTKAPNDPSTLHSLTSGSGHPNSKLSSDTRCHWNEAKVQQLISFYSEHSCLWNHKLESYRNRLLRQSLLEMLSSVLSDNEPVPFTVEDVKTKFRNLRTIFQREHKAVSSNKTCGSEDFYFPKWKHYRDLMFLCDSCDEEERPEELHFIEPQDSRLLHLDNQAPPPSLHDHSSSQSAAKLNIMPQSLDAPPSPTPPDSQRSSPSTSPCTSPSSRTDSRVSGRKRASRRPLAMSNEVLDFMRTLCQNQKSPHAGFLKYVEECLNETPPDKVKKLKKKIIETIHSVSEG
ncbi:uncharacterized protein LOC141804993 isoform X2 [Halichoeres trimaculatus]|uniref:uncharacterized protein LOC141804993 isoform X2 n=1 Tax=Halichoeres trimaculatus TaxID=147232 RepID=UPI003D9E46B3